MNLLRVDLSIKMIIGVIIKVYRVHLASKQWSQLGYYCIFDVQFLKQEKRRNSVNYTDYRKTSIEMSDTPLKN